MYTAKATLNEVELIVEKSDIMKWVDITKDDWNGFKFQVIVYIKTVDWYFRRIITQ